MRTQHVTRLRIAAAILSVIGFVACSKSSTTNPTSPAGTDSLAIYKKIYGATSVTQDGDFVVIKTTGLPDHKSVYYKGTQWQDSLYQAYNGSNPHFMAAPGIIAQSNTSYRIPMHPVQATTKQATPLGPIGVSLNGVAFFNQYNGQHNTLTVELNSMDQYNGHPTPMNEYHYHLEPWWLTASKGKAALLGFLLDGFPVYGPTENGKTITNADLDAYHGHTSATADYPHGIYHYHITSTDPYINGDGFYGTPGTVSR